MITPEIEITLLKQSFILAYILLKCINLFDLYYNLPFLHFKVNNASTLLNDYNERLQQELKDRHKVGKMIKDFLAAQKDLLAQAEERLEIYRDKLDKVNTIKDDLKSHIQSLPDLTQLPDVTGGLAPLPSAGDLFTVLR